MPSWVLTFARTRTEDSAQEAQEPEHLPVPVVKRYGLLAIETNSTSNQVLNVIHESRSPTTSVPVPDDLNDEASWPREPRRGSQMMCRLWKRPR